MLNDVEKSQVRLILLRELHGVSYRRQRGFAEVRRIKNLLELSLFERFRLGMGAYRQNGAPRPAQDLFRCRSEDEFPNSSPSARAHYDKVRFPVLGHCFNNSPNAAFSDQNVALHSRETVVQISPQ